MLVASTQNIIPLKIVIKLEKYAKQLLALSRIFKCEHKGHRCSNIRFHDACDEDYKQHIGKRFNLLGNSPAVDEIVAQQAAIISDMEALHTVARPIICSFYACGTPFVTMLRDRQHMVASTIHHMKSNQ